MGEHRFFAWVRTYVGKTPVEPQIIYCDDGKTAVGPKLEVVGRHLLHPNEWGLSIDALTQRYPAPAIEE